jgi:hypothetical protein
MKTLIIHPKDSTTSFLDIVYKDIADKTVVTGGVTKKELMALVESHDRIMMMGHGSPGGLFSIGQFKETNGYVIDQEFVDVLKERDNNVFIWCNADQFVNKHSLKGFFSGMFISEVGEALYCGLPRVPQKVVDESNYGFVQILGEHINDPQEEVYVKVRERYGEIAERNPVAEYNHKRLYLNK